MNVPDWLARHDGALRQGLSADTWFVLFHGEPEYRLSVHPAGGAFTCSIIQTANGKRLDQGKRYPTVQAALDGGLEELRAQLGW